MVKGVYWKVGVWGAFPVFARQDEDAGVKICLWHSADESTWNLTAEEPLEFGSGWVSKVLATAKPPVYEYKMDEFQWTLLWNSEPHDPAVIVASARMKKLESLLANAYSQLQAHEDSSAVHDVPDTHLCFSICLFKCP